MCEKLDTQIAFLLTGEKVNIIDEINECDSDKQYFCEDRHKLVKVKLLGRKCYFRHLESNLMSEWHKLWQSYFPKQTEITFKTHRADVYIESLNLIIES